MIFLIRLITATCLFAFLGKANVWLTPLSNVILAVGYRFFLILSPIFSRLGGRYAISLALCLSSLGAFFFCFNQDVYLILGAILVGIGFSVSGYLIKSQVSETPAGAAHNKIALNIGSLLSGLILLISWHSKHLFFGIAAVLLLLMVLLSSFSVRPAKRLVLPLPKKWSKKRWIAWLLIGVVVGIKLFGVFSVLPQTILMHSDTLPAWYGIMLFANSLIVIVLQLPIIHFIERFNYKAYSLKMTLVVMVLGMGLIGFPSIFNVSTFAGALIWTVLLSLVECFASYLDVCGARYGFLFIKEVAVGFGAGITVLLSRCLPSGYASLAIASVGMMCILLAVILVYDDLKQKG